MKYALIIILIVIAVPLILALFGKDDYTTEREVIINKPKQDVFNYILQLKNQVYYSKWVMADPNAKLTFTGTDGTVGFNFAWDSDNKDVGKGDQTITKIMEGERIDLGIHFIKPFEGTSEAYFKTEAIGPNQTKVVWGFHGNMKYFMKVVSVFFSMDKMIGKDLATGLDNLKKVMEK